MMQWVSIRASRVLLFTFISYAVKIVFHEFIKHQVLQQNVQSRRSIAAYASMPTIVVDSQMRIVFFFKNPQTAVWAIALMSGLEITTRIVKSQLVLRYIVYSFLPPTAEARNMAMAEHDKWKTRVLRFHVAEIAADMHAEYIAIGCCYATLFFYWSHPKYELGRWLNDGIAANATYSTNLEMLPLQIGSELLVDYISCFWEIWHDLTFKDLERDRHFHTVNLVMITAITVYLSSLLFLE